MRTNFQIPEGRVVQLHGIVDDVLAQRVIAELLFHQMEDINSPVVVEINSPGGSVSASLAIIDTMKFVKCPVWTRCQDVAQGTALMIFAAGIHGHRSASPDALFGFTRTKVAGSTHDAETTKAITDKMDRRLIQVVAEACRKQPTQVRADMLAGRSFTMNEASAYGLVAQKPPLSTRLKFWK